MKTHKFTLIIAGVAEITPELADALYSATKGDIELNLRDGVVFLEFERTAPTLREAVTGAIREVEGANVGVRVVRVLVGMELDRELAIGALDFLGGCLARHAEHLVIIALLLRRHLGK